jgi:hypothetical protein
MIETCEIPKFVYIYTNIFYIFQQCSVGNHFFQTLAKMASGLKQVLAKMKLKEELIMFAIWYLPRFGNSFIQSAAKCTYEFHFTEIGNLFVSILRLLLNFS